MPRINRDAASPRRGTGPTARTTLAIIAAEAGLSLPTVSKVVSGRPDVAASTRARVEQLLAAHHYLRTGAGRQRRSGLIDLVFNGLASHDTDGVILVISKPIQAQLEQLRSSGIPLVVVDPANPPPPEIPSVGATNWAGGLAATEHLISLGHRRIAAIAGSEDYLCSRARVDGYRSALERAGVTFDWALVRHGDFHHEGGFVRGGELLDLADRPTAIFAGNDQHALGGYEAARQRSLRIPQDLSVVGFEDLPVARWLSPPLTTIRQPLAEMGRAAAQMLGELIEDRPLRSRRVELSTELITRESTGPVEVAR